MIKKSELYFESQLKFYKEADEEVLMFIADFVLHNPKLDSEDLSSLFTAGYCYYFAHMLKIAFNRGEVCLCAPYSHFVWLDDTNNIAYDIQGVYDGEAEVFIPYTAMGDMVKDFTHVRSQYHNTTEFEIQKLINNHRKERA